MFYVIVLLHLLLFTCHQVGTVINKMEFLLDRADARLRDAALMGWYVLHRMYKLDMSMLTLL